MNIFSFTDYREWLKDSLEELKREKPFASLRFFCSKTKLDPGNFVRVLQGKMNLGKKGILSIGDFFKLDKKQKIFFEELVIFSKAKTDKEAWNSFERLQIIKGVDVRSLADHEFEFFRKWYHAVIRSLISIMEFKNEYRLLAQMVIPQISVKEAKDSVKLLEKLKMIQKDDKGIWRVKEQFIGSGRKWKGQSIRKFQEQSLDLAKESLENHSPEIRDISTVTLTLPRSEFKVLKERIREFRKELLSISNGFEGEDGVYQLNISMIPVGVLKKGRKP